MYVLMEGRESLTLDAFLERETMAYAKAVRLAKMERDSVLSMAKVKQFLMIIEDKLGRPGSTRWWAPCA